MYPDYETTFYLVMVVSIVMAFWLEAWLPLENIEFDLLHASRNFIFWFLAFIFADYLVAHYWIDVQSLIQQQPFGVFYWISMPYDWMLVAIGIVIIDVADYLYHRLSHSNRFLWRIHRVHHTDTAVDVSTALRTHPFEMVLSNFWKYGFVLLFGIPIWVIGFREIFVFPLVFLQHSNTALPQKIESALARVLITPNIHRLHHSIVPVEHDSNYGEWLVFWDKVFGTFRQPVAAKPDSYGVNMLTDEKHQTIKGMMLTPFRHDLRTHQPAKV